MLERQESEELRNQGILFVDDEIGLREGWKRLLSGDHRTVITAADAESAIAGLSHHPVDLVICDLRLPGADGLAVLKWVNEHKPGTRFVLVTGYGSAEVEQKARHLGAFGYLEKPVQPDVLEAIAESALWGTPSTRADRSSGEAQPWIDPRGQDAALELEVARPVELVPDLELSMDAAVESEPVGHGTLRDLGRLATAPFLGLAFVVFLPLIAFGAVCYAIGAKTLQLIRRAVPSRVGT
jgi:DNA-binding NarL/FixJ family response regulator